MVYDVLVLPRLPLRVPPPSFPLLVPLHGEPEQQQRGDERGGASAVQLVGGATRRSTHSASRRQLWWFTPCSLRGRPRRRSRTLPDTASRAMAHAITRGGYDWQYHANPGVRRPPIDWRGSALEELHQPRNAYAQEILLNGDISRAGGRAHRQLPQALLHQLQPHGSRGAVIILYWDPTSNPPRLSADPACLSAELRRARSALLGARRLPQFSSATARDCSQFAFSRATLAMRCLCHGSRRSGNARSFDDATFPGAVRRARPARRGAVTSSAAPRGSLWCSDVRMHRL